MKRQLTVIAAALWTLLLAACGETRNTRFTEAGMPVADDTATAASEDTLERQITLLFAGDLMQHGGQIKAAWNGKTYQYDDVFSRMTPVIEEADIAIANFEVTLGGPPYEGYPRFSAPDEYLRASTAAGFDVLLTSNNHCCDTGAKGLGRTLDLMDSIGVPHLGTYRNQEERNEHYPFVLEKDGWRIVLLNFTYGTNGLRVPQPFIVNMMDTTEVALDIEKARNLDADAIIAIPHWGIEYDVLPSKEQRWWAEWLLSHGVDHVIGGHPHVVQPFEMSEDSEGKRHLVVYSLGNFVSNMTRDNTFGGAVVRLTLAKRGQKTRTERADYSLYWVSRPTISGRKNFRVYPANYPTDSLNAAEQGLRNRYLGPVRELLGKHNKGIAEQP